MSTVRTKNIKTKSRHKGATLLIAILLASVMLSVGLGVYQRTYKQLVFSSFWKQMQVAFAAAGGGLECALYWDLHPSANYTCFGNIAAPWPTVFPATLSMSTTVGCVVVDITKNVDYPFTTIESRGYNVSCAVVTEATNPRIVERGIRIDY